MAEISQVGKIGIELPHGLEVPEEKLSQVLEEANRFGTNLCKLLGGEDFFNIEVDDGGTIAVGETAKARYFEMLRLPLDIEGKTLILEFLDRKNNPRRIETQVTRWKIIRKYHIKMEFADNVIGGDTLTLFRILPSDLGGPAWGAERWRLSTQWQEGKGDSARTWDGSSTISKMEFV